MNSETLSIKYYNANNVSEYHEVLSTHYKPQELSAIASLYFEHNRTVVLMTRHYESKFLFWRVDHDDIIGYCIIQDIRDYKPNEREIMSGLFSISLDVLKMYPTVISDFMIAKDLRRQGYGTTLANNVILNYYPDVNMSLHAVEDGVFFWDKLGFKYVDGLDSVMIRNGGDIT